MHCDTALEGVVAREDVGCVEAVAGIVRNPSWGR